MKEINGDLFLSSGNLAHCVSADLVMGLGIAVEFKKRFGRIDELKKQNPTVGSICVLQREDNTYIYYLITKQLYWHKPTYETLSSSLQAMKYHMVANNITEVSMPRIGCGLDKLKWLQVEKIIKKIFNDIQVNIYTLP